MTFLGVFRGFLVVFIRNSGPLEDFFRHSCRKCRRWGRKFAATFGRKKNSQPILGPKGPKWNKVYLGWVFWEKMVFFDSRFFQKMYILAADFRKFHDLALEFENVKRFLQVWLSHPDLFKNYDQTTRGQNKAPL